MAKNKKAQILAAVMCATTVVGISPAISSAEDHIISNNSKAFIEVVDNGAESGRINAQADDLTFTVGDNTFAMDQYSTTISNGTAEIFVGQDALQFSNGSTVQVGSAGTIFSNNGTTTTINGNTISTGTLTAGSTDIDGDVISHINGNKYSLNQIGQKTSGIYSDGIGTTTIEGTIFNDGTITADTITAGTLNIDDFNVNGTVNVSGDVVTTTENGNVYSLNDTAEKVSGMYRDIDPNTGHGITYIEGNALSENGIASVGDVTSTGFNGNVYSLNTIGSNVSGIYRNIDPNTGAGVTAIEGNTFISENGIVTNSLTVGGIDIGEMAGTTSQIADKVQGIEHGQYKDPTTGEVTGEYTKVEDVYISGTNINAGGFTVTDGNVNTTGDVVVGGDLTVVGTINGKDITDIATGADVSAVVGDTSKLTTTDKTNVVSAVNEVNGKVGDTSKLNSEVAVNGANTSLVDAVNAETTMRQQLSGRVDGLEGRVGSLEERMGDVEDRIDKVGAMSAAIANLRTMGYDPEAPTEIAVGVGQYKSETGLALGVFHYPNEDFMLSASISTSGDEVMGGIGATWKIGRKSTSERAVNKEKSRELKAEEKAAEMKQAAQKSKVDAQRERHAKMLAEREAANK